MRRAWNAVSTRTGAAFDLANGRQVALVSGAHAVNEFFSLAIPPVIPFLVGDFGLTYARAGLLMSAYFAMYAVFQLPVGFLADRVGRSGLIAVGTTVMALGLFGASLASTYGGIAAGVALSGVGGSTYHPAGMSLVSDAEPDATAGRAMGVHEVAGIAGNLLAPVVVGGVASLAGWRTGFRVAAGLGLCYAVLFALGRGVKAAGDSPDSGGDRTAVGSSLPSFRSRASVQSLAGPLSFASARISVARASGWRSRRGYSGCFS